MEIKEALKGGPLVGKELYESTGPGVFALWKACRKDEEITTRTVGRQYLRFDRQVEGYARLSPSLEREFLSYTIVGLEVDNKKIRKHAVELYAEIKRISEKKLALAGRAVRDVLEKLEGHRDEIEDGACFIIGGDVPLYMAHADPRPEKSTGKIVSGSDLDIVVILKDDFPADLEEALDEAVYDVKYNLLMRPNVKEEIDYIIKRRAAVVKQAAFDTFERMVACKIIDEGQFLWGSEKLYGQALAILDENAIPQKLKELKSLALEYRKRAIEALLQTEELSEDAYTRLFTTTEEFGEIF
ncbi:MAG: hypothetical protein V3R93_00505 [Candidatus Hydrothermarchaeaceae archaeon]